MKFIQSFRFVFLLLAVAFAFLAGDGTAHAKGGHGGHSGGHMGHNQHTGHARHIGDIHHGISAGSHCSPNSSYYDSPTASYYCCNSSGVYYPCERVSPTPVPFETERKMIE